MLKSFFWGLARNHLVTIERRVSFPLSNDIARVRAWFMLVHINRVSLESRDRLSINRKRASENVAISIVHIKYSFHGHGSGLNITGHFVFSVPTLILSMLYFRISIGLKNKFPLFEFRSIGYRNVSWISKTLPTLADKPKNTVITADWTVIKGKNEPRYREWKQWDCIQW